VLVVGCFKVVSILYDTVISVFQQLFTMKSLLFNVSVIFYNSWNAYQQYVSKHTIEKV